MQSALADQAIALPAEDRVELIGRLWDSLVADGHEPALTDAQRAEVSRRTQRLERTGSLGQDWSVVRASLINRDAD